MLCKWIAPATRETLNVRRPGKVQPGSTLCVSHRYGGIPGACQHASGADLAEAGVYAACSANGQGQLLGTSLL